MTTPEIIFLCVVLLVGVPAMWRNATAAALVLSWTVGQMVWVVSGDSLPLKVYLLCDLTVLAIIYCKPEARGYFPYRDLRHQLSQAWFERSLWDRVVIAIFPLMWATYAMPISDYHRWWALYYLCLAQFLAAGAESLISRRAANTSEKPSDHPSSGLKFQAARGWSYG